MGEGTITENLRRGGLPSASAMTRISHCPASFRLNAMELPSPSSEAADEGTKLHRVMELAAYGAEKADEFLRLFNTLSPEQATAVSNAQEALNKIAFKFDAQHDDKHDAYFERRLEFRNTANEVVLTGKGDYVGIIGNAAFVVDYKFGRGYVEPAERNFQLAAMAVLVAQMWPVESVDVHIIQPRAESERKVTSAHYTREDIDYTREKIFDVCEEALYSDSPRQSVGYWCKFCDSKYRCAAAQKAMDEETVLVAKGFEITTENVREVFEKAKFVGKVCADIAKKCADVVAQNPDVETGLYFAEGASVRKIDDTLSVLTWLEKKLGRELTDAEFSALVSFKIGDLESFFASELKKTSPDKKITKKALNEAFGRELSELGLLIRTPKTPSLKVKE